LYDVSPHDALALTVAPAILLASALVAAFVPAIGAARVDPVIALRAD
jgi:ABC-type antimicrobial peptide transport system permease subunit